jgi:hypothetical protein
MRILAIILVSFIAFSTEVSSAVVSVDNFGFVASEKKAEKLLLDFYTKYFHAFLEMPPALSEKKLDSLQKQFCTPGFYQKIPKILEKTGADVFLKAQDSDIRYLMSLKIKKDLKRDAYIVSYVGDGQLNEKITIKIFIRLVKVGNSYKIDSVR